MTVPSYRGNFGSFWSAGKTSAHSGISRSPAVVLAMYFQITLFNVVTLFLMAATLVITAKRLTASSDTNWPLAYYGLLLTYWRGYMYTLDNYWVIGGVLCGLVLRFEFLGGTIEKIIRALELLVFGYIAWSCVRLILQW